MARKTDSISENNDGFGDIVGLVLLGAAVLLFVAQISYDGRDLACNYTPPNHPTRNWIGILGAWVADKSFFLFGASAYVLPPLLLAFSLAHLPGVLRFAGLHAVADAISHLAERWKSQVAWAVAGIFSFAGLLNLLNDGRHTHHLETWRIHIASQSLGGWLGYTTCGGCPGGNLRR